MAYRSILRTRAGSHLRGCGGEDAEPSFETIASGEVAGDCLVETGRLRHHTHRREHVPPELVQLTSYESGPPAGLLGSEPEHPVPEVTINRGQVRCSWLPGWFAVMRLGEDEVELDGTSNDGHPAPVVAERIPLLSDGLKRRKERGDVTRHLLEVGCLDCEIPIRQRCRHTVPREPTSRTRRTDGCHSTAAIASSLIDTYGECPIRPWRASADRQFGRGEAAGSLAPRVAEQ